VPNADDNDKPMMQVLREQPGLNGFCYYTQLGAWWMAGAHEQVQGKRYVNEAFHHNGFDHGDISKEPLVNSSYMDGDKQVTFTTHLQPWYFGSAYDIPYIHALGWLQGQRLNRTLLRDPASWDRLGEAECQRIKDLEHFDDDTFTFTYHRDDRTMTTRDFRAHAYGKCILGSSVGELLWGNFAIGCVLPGNYVGHGKECDDYYGTLEDQNL
jgi:hypothetical protein